MIRFAFYIHNHQPIGNFEHVFEHAYNHSYRPLLEALIKHQTVKFGIHNSGPLLEWIQKKHPEYIELLKELVRRGQAEILVSAFSEPILSLIPRRDMLEQIKYFNDFIYRTFDFSPRGLWLTERVWEPKLISPLVEAGIQYTLLDSNMFLHVGLEEDELNSYYITEDEGSILKIFPISMRLRYLIPFQQVDRTIDFMKEQEGKRDGGLVCLGDDGEKFGVWPGTYDWVYNQGWLEKFLSRIESEPWIKTVLLDDVIKEPAAGRIYLPTASYEEMGEWVLPPKLGLVYEEIKNNLDDKYYHLISGGYFRNFLSKYPEANLMHKRMIYVSKNIGDDPKAKMALWRGQCSCAYWHGIFGGLYLPHLREAIYENLIEADNFHIKKGFELIDFDADGEQEIVYSDADFFFVIKPKPASLLELDDRKRKKNILNYLGRREEKYHHKLPKATTNSEVKSIHETFQSKEKDLVKYLVYDQYEKSFGLDHLLTAKPTVEEFRRSEGIGSIITYPKYEILKDGRFAVKFSGVIEKLIERTNHDAGSLQFSYQGDFKLLGVEFPLGIFGKKIVLNKEQSLFENHSIDGIEKFTITVDDQKPIEFSANRSFDLRAHPIETVSSSEAGFERNFQGCALLLIFTEPPIISIKL